MGAEGSGNNDIFSLGGFKITGDCNCAHEIQKLLILGRKTMTNLDTILKSREGLYNQVYGFYHVLSKCKSWIHKRLNTEEMMLSNFGAGRDSYLSDCKVMKPVSPKGNQFCIRRSNAEAENPIFWLLNVKS